MAFYKYSPFAPPSLKFFMLSPGWVAQSAGTSSHKPKSCRFNCERGSQLMFLSLPHPCSLSLPSSLSAYPWVKIKKNHAQLRGFHLH